MNSAEARAIASSRHPPHPSEAGSLQPCPRRIRPRRRGETVLDTGRASYGEKDASFLDGVPTGRPGTNCSGDES